MNTVKHMIRNILRTNETWSRENSFLNCHVQGVHSIMISPSFRMYIADETHTLYHNSWYTRYEKQSVAFHAHHCDLQLMKIHGNQLHNISLHDDTFESHYGDDGMVVNSFLHKSKILTGEGRFDFVGKKRIHVKEVKYMDEFKPINLAATDIHSMYADEGRIFAWTVLAGKENPDYDARCFSTQDLTKFTGEGLYIPMTVESYRHTLSIIDINLENA